MNLSRWATGPVNAWSDATTSAGAGFQQSMIEGGSRAVNGAPNNAAQRRRRTFSGPALKAPDSRRRTQQYQRASVERLPVAGHERVPVREGPVRVALPRPDVQLVQRRQAVPVRCTDVVRQMSLQRRRTPIGMRAPNRQRSR
ncbi:MAG: hypothetical protein ACREV5_09560 [Steroidobacter sp.]